VSGLSLLLNAACSSSGNEAPKSEVSLQLDWFPEPEHLGFYEAAESPLLKEVGVELELLSGGPNSMAMQKVGSGQVDLGIWRSDDIIVQVSRGMPLVIVGAYMQHDPQALMMHAASPVRDFRDLDGRAVMVGQASMWVDFIQKHFDIRFQFIPLNYSLASFMDDPDMIRQCYVTSEPYFAEQQGVPVRTLLISDSGFDPYRVIFTSREFLEAHPELVERVHRAAMSGWGAFVQDDYGQGLARLEQVNDELTPGFVNYVRDTLLEKQLLLGNPAIGEALGVLDRTRLAEQARQLYDNGFTECLLDPEDFAVFNFSTSNE